MISLSRILTRRRDRRLAGTASIEFAILAPILFAIVFGAIDYGLFEATESGNVAAARIGAEYARIQPACVSPLGTACAQAANLVKNYIVPLSGLPPLVSGTIACTCADNSAETVACPPVGAIAPCSGTVVNGVSNPRVFVYVTVKSSIKLYRPLFGAEYFGSSLLTASSTIRTQ